MKGSDDKEDTLSWDAADARPFQAHDQSHFIEVVWGTKWPDFMKGESPKYDQAGLKGYRQTIVRVKAAAC